MRYQHPDSGGDQEPGRSRGQSTQRIPEHRQMRVLENRHAEGEADRPWYQEEPGDGGEHAAGAAKSRARAHRDADDVRARHELTEADDVSEFPFGDPPTLFDGDAPRPDETAATPHAVQRDLEERGEQGPERHRLAGMFSFRRSRHG